MNVTYKNMALLASLFVGLASCSTSEQNDGVPSGDDFRSGWEVPFDGSVSNPVVHDGLVIVGSFDGSIVAFDAKGGTQVWRYQTGVGLTSGPEIIRIPGDEFEDLMGAALETIGKKAKGKREIHATPVIEDDTVYVGSRDHKFYALDARTGTLKWATDIDHQISREALVTSEHIVVHCMSQGLAPDVVYVLRKEDGQVMWSTEGKGSATYPSLGGNIVYYGLSDKEIRQEASSFFVNAVELDTGRLLWTLELQGRRPNETYTSADLVYVTAFTGGHSIHLPDDTVTYAPTAIHVYAVNASTGKLVWEFKGGDGALSSPPLAVGPKQIFFVVEEGLYAVDKSTGEQDWCLQGAYFPLTIQLNENLYVDGDSLRTNESVSAIDPSTGKVVWCVSPGDNLFLRGIIDDAVYVSAETSLISLDAKTGKQLWKFNTGGLFKEGTDVSAAPVKHAGQLIFPTGTNFIWGREPIQGHLYSIDARTGKLN